MGFLRFLPLRSYKCIPHPKTSYALLTLLVIGGIAAIVFQQHQITTLREAQRLAEERAQTFSSENRDLAEARKRAEDEVRRARVELATMGRQRTTVPTRPQAAPGPMTSPAPVAGATAETRPPVSSQNTPATRMALHERYDRFLFQQRGLTPAQAERVIDLWIAQNEARADLQAAVEEQNLTAGPKVEKMRDALNEPITREIQQILGNEGYLAYREYETTSGFRYLIDKALQPQFNAASAPLTEQQTDQLARIMSVNKTLIRDKPTDLGSRAEIDWTGVARDAAGILTPAQLAVIQARAGRK